MSAPFLLKLAEAVRLKNGHKFPPLGSVAYKSFFQLLPRSIDIELLPGIRATLDTQDGTQKATYWQGTRFEQPTPAILREWASEKGAVFFDIGSNYGWFSFYLASELPELSIYPFEPNPPTFERLQKIVTRNALTQIHPTNIGLGENVMTCRLRIGIEDSGHSTFGPHPDLDEATAVEVPVKPFDLWRSEIGLDLPSSPSWVAKIDVEGFECHVIAGMQEALLAKAFKGLAIEVNRDTLEFCGDSEKKLISLLKGFGYIEKPLHHANERGQMNKFFIPRA